MLVLEVVKCVMPVCLYPRQIHNVILAEFCVEILLFCVDKLGCICGYLLIKNVYNVDFEVEMCHVATLSWCLLLC
jgi:hypothetical protein